MGPGVAAECEGKNGLHIYEDHFIPEIIDPQTLQTLPPGAEGELVLTTLSKEAFPVVRYRTRDITTLDYSPCPCGRTLVRMKKVLRRSDDILIHQGDQSVSLAGGGDSHGGGRGGTPVSAYRRPDRRSGYPGTPGGGQRRASFPTKSNSLQNISAKIERRLREIIGVSAKVKLVAPESLRPADGKIQKVVDRRKEMMDEQTYTRKGRQRYVYRRGERSSPLTSIVAAPGIHFTFSEPIESNRP